MNSVKRSAEFVMDAQHHAPHTPLPTHTPAPHQAHQPHQPGPDAHRIPVVPSAAESADEPRVPLMLRALGILFATLVVVGAGKFAYSLVTRPANDAPGDTHGVFEDYLVTVRAPITAPESEESRVDITVTNTSLLEKTVGVGVIEDGVFSTSGSRRIITLKRDEREDISLPFIGVSEGSWVLRVGLYDQNNHVIGIVSQPVSIVKSGLSVRLSMGEKAAIQVPRNGRVFATLTYDASASTTPLTDVTFRLTSNPEKTITLQKIKPGQRGSYTIWTTVPAHLRGQFVNTASLGLHVRANWTDALGTTHITEQWPRADVITLSAFPRMYDSRGKLLSGTAEPLQPGKPSTFWINLTLGRTVRDAQSVLIRAKLADGVSFTGKTWVNNKDRIAYDSGTGAIVWQTRPLAKTDKNTPIAGFEVTFTPSADSIGTLPALLSWLTADKNPLFEEVRTPHDVEIGSVVADFRFDPYAAALNGVRK